MKKTFLIGISLVLLATFIGLLYSQPATGASAGRSQKGQQAWVESLSDELDGLMTGVLSETSVRSDSLQQLAAYFSPKRP